MIQMINKLKKNQKGFTLVELIVVLVILAILAAFTIPAMLGFVDDARGKATIAQAREVYMAYTTSISELAGDQNAYVAGVYTKAKDAANTAATYAPTDSTKGDTYGKKVIASAAVKMADDIKEDSNYKVSVVDTRISEIKYKSGDFLIIISYPDGESSGNVIIEKNGVV